MSKEMSRDEILEDQAKYQAWRPVSENEFLVDRMAELGIPFCVECHDWHDDDEAHSMQYNDGVWM